MLEALPGSGLWSWLQRSRGLSTTETPGRWRTWGTGPWSFNEAVVFRPRKHLGIHLCPGQGVTVLQRSRGLSTTETSRTGRWSSLIPSLQRSRGLSTTETWASARGGRRGRLRFNEAVVFRPRKQRGLYAAPDARPQYETRAAGPGCETPGHLAECCCPEEELEGRSRAGFERPQGPSGHLAARGAYGVLTVRGPGAGPLRYHYPGGELGVATLVRRFPEEGVFGEHACWAGRLLPHATLCRGSQAPAPGPRRPVVERQVCFHRLARGPVGFGPGP
jgi:hypothetical protein